MLVPVAIALIPTGLFVTSSTGSTEVGRHAATSNVIAVSETTPSTSATQNFHDGRSVVRVHVQTTRELRTVLALAQDVLNHRIDIGPVDFIVDAQGLAAVTASGLKYEILVRDLGPLLRAEFASRGANGEFRRGGGDGGGDGGNGNDGGVAGDDFFTNFRTLAEIDARLAELAAARPDLVTLFTLGTSLEGRPIRGVRMTKAPAGSPGVLFNATQHAREWGATSAVTFIANELVSQYGVDARVTALLDRAWIDVVPVCNPDGYIYTWSTNRLWRKNRRNNGDGTFGVDLNRNWAFQWGGGGASANGADETYRGPSAFSEPESAALRDYFVRETLLAGHIDFHAYSQLILSPWGYTTTLPAINAAFLALGSEMRASIARTTGASYTAGPIATTLYVASGSSVDHAYGAHGVPSYTIEVRDTGSYGFVMPTSEILPNARENFAAALDLADATVDGAVLRLASGAPASLEYDGARSITVEARAMRGSLSANPVTLFARVGESGAFTPVAATASAADTFTASLPFDACGARIQWFITATTSFGTARLPRTPGATFATDLVETNIAFEDTFESNLGWVVGATGDNATSGIWTRVDPVGTAAQPENDSSDLGALCFITGQGVVGGGLGAADVDGGTTSLTSPALPVTSPEALIAYRRWYSNNTGTSPLEDSMPVSISADGGPFVPIELVGENAGAWVEKMFRIADFVPGASSVRLRFVARDLGAGSIIEAGVDHVRVLVSACPAIAGDLDGDGDVDAADLSALLSAWGSPAGDLNADGATDAADLAVMLGNWG